jgi:hypothetical protein
MHYFEDSFRNFPSNFDNLIVLGFLYFKDEIYEKAIQYFELAAKVQPNAVIFIFNPINSTQQKFNTPNASINSEITKTRSNLSKKFITSTRITERL